MPSYHETDVPQLEGYSEDLPITPDLPPKQSPVQIEDMNRSHAAVVKSDVEGINVFEAFQNLPTDTDPKQLLNLLSYQRAEMEQEDIRQYFDQNRGNTVEEAVANAEIYDQMLQEADAARYKPEKQIVESFAGLDVEQDLKDRIESEIRLSNAINEMVDDYTFLEKGIDIFKALLPSVAIDNYQISGSPFGAATFMRDVITGFKEMKRTDPAKFNETFPVFYASIKEDLPKNKVIGVLGAIAIPRGEELVGENFRNIDAALDILDLATLGTYTATKIGRLVSNLNAIRIAKKLRNTELAAEINTAAMVDETGEVAAKAGITPETAYSNSAPFDVNELDASHTPDISTETIANINKVKEEQRRVAQIIASESGILRESILTPAERKLAEERFTRDMKTQGIDNVRMSQQHRDYTTFEYDVKDPATGETLTKTERMDLQFKDKSETFSRTDEGLLTDWVKSPTVWAKNLLDDVYSAIRLDSTSSVVGALLKGLQRDALAPLLGKSGLKSFRPAVRRQMAEIDKVLLAGDQFKDGQNIRGKVYTIDELKGGVDGVKLNDKQIEVYYNLRGLYDELWTIRNDETRRILTAQGKKEIGLPSGPQIGVPYTREGAVGTINSEGTLQVYNVMTDEIMTVRSTDISKMYDEGLVLSRLDEAHAPIEGSEELFDMVVTAADKTNDLPHKVLHYREGYVPKVNKNSYWFAKQTGSRTINGKIKTDQVLKTERMFSSRTEAEAWIKAQGRNDLIALPDRALERQIVGSSQVGAGGGLYTGPRAVEDIPFGLDGLPAERLNTYEALSQNIQSLENYVSRNAWRMAMQEKWIKSVQAAGLDETGEIARAGFKPELLPSDDPRAVKLKQLGEQIKIWSGFPTKGELLWDGAVANAMEWALNKPFLPKGITIKTANFLRNSGDPITKMRGIAFHTLLGFFNPAQLWVQAQGAAVAAAMVTSARDPFAAARVFRLQTALAFASRFEDSADAIKMIAKAGGVSEKEMAQVVRMWKRSGLESSVLNTADHTAALKGYGMTAEALRRLSDKGMIFYRAGELFNRRFSFLSALERKKRELGHINLTDTQLKDVLSESNNFMLNLSKSNRAAWQRGPLALPTQFLQVQAKFIEELILPGGKSFSMGERAKILAAQLGLYGAAGVPLGNFALRYFQESLGMTQADVDNLDEKTVKFINGGFWDWFAYSMLGADVDVANRGAIASGITEFYTDLIFSESSVGEKISGAFGIVPHRFFTSIRDIRPMMAGALFHGSDITGEELLQAFNAMASITSTWNNAEKGAVMTRLNQLQDSKGRLVIAGKDFKPIEEVMIMLGFQPSELRRVRERDLLVKASEEYRNQTTQWLVDNYWLYVRAMKGADSAAERDQISKNFEVSSRVIYQTLRNEDEVRKVSEALKNRLMKGEDEKTRSIRQFIEEYYDSQVLRWGTAAASLQASGMIQNDLPPINTEDLQ